MSAYQEVRRLIDETRQLEAAIENSANALADLLERNLRHVSPYRLARIKKALGDFNANTKEWTR